MRELYEHVFDRDPGEEQKMMHVFVSHARKIIAAATGGRDVIETVWGKGYRLAEPLPPEC